MPVLAPDQLVLELHETNCRLRYWLDSLVTGSNCSPACLRAPTPEQMSGLLSELLRVGEWLRARRETSTAELEQELLLYRQQVERLRDLLPGMRGVLLAERARLEQERERVKMAAEWARMSHQTL